MHVLAPILSAVKRVVHRFFVCNIRLSAGRSGVSLRFDEPRRVRVPSAAEIDAKRRRAELDLMLQQLREALNAVPDARTELRHLGFVEQALEREGLRALSNVPVDVLQKALDQFESLVSNWSAQGLASLRSRMAVAVRERENDEGADKPAVREPARPC